MLTWMYDVEFISTYESYGVESYESYTILWSWADSSSHNYSVGKEYKVDSCYQMLVSFDRYY